MLHELKCVFHKSGFIPTVIELFVVISNFDTSGVALELNVLMINLKAELFTKRV